MRRLTLIAVAQLMLCGLAPHAWGNDWVNRGGMLNPGAGWFQWVHNSVDGRHCSLNYNGSLQCYDARSNVHEMVYLDRSQTPDPQNGDLQIFGWDHVNKEYLAMDGGRTIGPHPMAFSMITRTWRILTNADFDMIESRTVTSSAGSATSPDHDVFVVFAGSAWGYAGKKTLVFDLRNRTYRELPGPASMSKRNNTQGQLLYISSLKRFLLFGGQSEGGALLNDLWLLDPVTWTWAQVSPQNPPPGRIFSQMAYDRVQNKVYLYGGWGADDGEVSVLHVNNWSWEHLPEPTGTVRVNYPGLRRVGAGMFDPSAGFCSGSGVLVGTDWIGSAAIWCWTHQFDGSAPPPPPPTPAWVKMSLTTDRMRFEYHSAPPGGVDLYDCTSDISVVDCRKR